MLSPRISKLFLQGKREMEQSYLQRTTAITTTNPIKDCKRRIQNTQIADQVSRVSTKYNNLKMIRCQMINQNKKFTVNKCNPKNSQLSN